MICFSVFGRKDFCSLLLCCVNFDYARERKSQESAEVVIGTMNSVVFLSMVFLLSGFSLTLANVVLIGNNVTLSFDDVEANFALAIKGSGECGVLYPAEPLDACSKLTNKVKPAKNGSSPFVLIIRGGCSFEDKVRRAQEASFKAAVVYDNEDGGALVAMAGNSAGIKIHAVFVSKTSGEKLKNYAGLTDMEVWLIPSFENSAWSIMAISFISLLAMSAVLAICFFVHRHRIRRERPCVREFHGMSSRLVKAMPSLIFTAVLEDNCTSMTCAICLEDYSIGEKLRILPCCHKFVATKFSFSSCVICTSQQYNSLAEFHAFCVDSWLTSWRTFCPVCKRDARTTTGYPPALESTPLLSSSPASVASSSVLSSVRSSLVSSSAIQIARASSHSPSLSRPHSLTSSSYVQQPLRSFYRQSPSLAISRSSMDLQNASSQRSHSSYLASGYSLGYPSFSPLNSRYLSTHIPSPSNASLPLVSSSSHQHNPLHCSESAVSFSPFASAQTLPEC